MSQRPEELESGFRLGDCSVHPQRGQVEGPRGEQHVEPKAMAVLLVLADNAGEVVSREQLLDAVWPQTYSGDAALTRCVSLLRSSLSTVGEGDVYIETISKKGYRLLADVVALDGGEPVNDPSPAEPQGSGSLPLPWLAALVLILALAAWWWRSSSAPMSPADRAAGNPAAATTAPVADHAIAVLPFANLSGDTANQYFSDGIAEEILNVLGQLPRLRVTSRSSSFAFRDRGLSLPQLAEELGVESVLEGSVRQWDDQIRISVQLIDARNDVLLWSGTFERELDNLFVIQEEIALSVADTLKVALDIDGTEGLIGARGLTPIDPEAHAAYLRGRHLAPQRTQGSLEAALTAFEQALSIEPEYAEAMAQLAITYLLLNRRNYGDLPEAESLGQAKLWSARAMDLAPGLAEVQAAVGFAAWRAGEAATAEQHFQRALDINPSYAIVWHWLAMLQYRNLGKHEESLASSRRSRALDPVSIPSFTIYIQMLISRGRFDEVRAELEKLEPVSPVSYHRMRGELEAIGGQWSSLALANLDALMIQPDLNSAQRTFERELFRLDLDAEAGSVGPVRSMLVLDRLGRSQEAVNAAEQALAADPESVWSQQRFARALVYNQEPERARPLLEGLWERSNHRIALVSSHFLTYSDGLALHHARLVGGDAAGAEAILDAIDAELVRVRQAGINTTRRAASPDFMGGISRFLRGDREGGLALVHKAVEDGYYVRLEAPFLESLVTDPGFAPIRQLQRANVARERERLLRAVCTGNPYAELWQPSEATCAEIR
jgi:TolB-like protein/DNA-binding winged helix-turn-helix (wHTH) protein